MFITDVHSLGLKVTRRNMYLTEGFYWNLNDETRAWSKRFFDQHKRMPTMVQAGQYSAVMHYLKAVKAVAYEGRHGQGDGPDEEDTGQRLLCQERHHPRGRPHGA